jgi:hypothetical protein
MPKRSSKKDINELAASIVESSTNSTERIENKKNPHAVALGRLGGLKGGRARAEKLTPEQRIDIARRAAAKRWSKATP